MKALVKSGVLIVAALLMAVVLRALPAKALQLDEPADFKAVQENVSKVRGDLEAAQCGGWDFYDTVDNKIPYVSGAPGRRSTFLGPDGKLLSEVAAAGLGNREESTGALEDGFVFPDSGRTSGWSTVCNVNECENSYPYIRECPDDPPCRNPEDCRQMCHDLNAWVRRHQDCTAEWTEWDAFGNPFRVYDTFADTSPCYNTDNGDWCHPGEDWVSVDAQLWDMWGNMAELDIWCDIDELLYCCSNAKVVDRDRDPDGNCIVCHGDGLEDRNNPGFDFNGERPQDLEFTGCRDGKYAPNDRKYVSIYRRHTVTYTRDPVWIIPRDDTSRFDVPVDCYCRYEEFDPKIRRTDRPDYRCVINLEDPDKRFNAMKETQRGKGEYGQNSNLPDPAYQHAAARDTRKDLWVNDFSDTFSLLNSDKFKESPKDNLFPLMQLDNTDIMPTAQLDVQRPFSSGSLIRSTDDTVHTDDPGRRTITEWWQEQETQAHKLFSSPLLRLVLPTPASIGLDLSDPFLTPRGSSSSNGKKINQQIIDIQINALPEDLLSEVSAYLENGLLLHVREEPVPLVVPMASSVELRALAQGWKRWGEEHLDGKSRAEEAARKLEDYADRIDRVRALRGELSQYIGRLLTYQGTMMRAIGEWLTANMQTWERYSAVHHQGLDLKPLWQEIQQKYRVFHDQTNMPWCRNDRFTTPIYSFLDNWMPGPQEPRDLMLNIDSQPANDITPYSLPRLSIEMLPDLVYDFTVLRVSTGTVILPVITPIQIRLQQSLFDPPTANDDFASVSARLDKIIESPDLPPVPTIYEEVLGRLFPTEVQHLSSPSMVETAIADVPPEVEQTMRRMLQMITGMDETYRKFWESITDFPERNFYRMWSCEHLNEMPCVHVEMDLLERFTRIGARPAVQIREDFSSYGPFRTDVIRDSNVAGVLRSMDLDPPTAVPPCPREDWACQIYNVEKTYAREGWRVEGIQEGEGKQDLANLRNRLWKQTIPIGSSSSFPYIVTPDEMLPSFNVPSPIILPTTRFGQSSSSYR
ncbi:hypothetical protein AUJ46_03355 [Candidatus Peregrinibacteria bacterium CG1_02_54_53]|nr:MAG: hypothetical protein AUJ46_03355 [Candidatus Peregrinibacteria bacterium CG1_02_54_53]